MSGAKLENWQAGYFGCFSNCGNCLKVCCCPACSYGWNAERLDGSSCYCNCLLFHFCAGCSCCYHPARRRLLREKYHLVEEPCSDCMASFPCCMLCAMCQEANEMELRGAPTSASMPNA